MKERYNRKKKKLRLVPLALGIYMILLGWGLILAGITSPKDGGAWGAVGIIRLLGGIVMACLGLYGIWDGIRDVIMPGEKTEPFSSSRFVLMDVTGNKSSNVTEELLRAQLKELMEREGSSGFHLQILHPFSVDGLGMLRQVSCIRQDGIIITAFFDGNENSPVIYEKYARTGEAEEFLKQVLEGSPKFPGWERVDAVVHQEEHVEVNHQLLVIYGESWRDEHKFFSARDLELAVEGVADKTYQKAGLGLGHVIFHILPGVDENLTVIWQVPVERKDNIRILAKKGTMTQVKFWMVQIFNNGLPEELNGWIDITDQLKGEGKHGKIF